MGVIQFSVSHPLFFSAEAGLRFVGELVRTELTETLRLFRVFFQVDRTKFMSFNYVGESGDG